MTNGEEVKWVKRRNECSLSLMFARLRLEIEQDIKERNALRPMCLYGFKFVSGASTFVALRQGNHLEKSISFSMENEHIIAKNDEGGTVMKASLTLNDEGECRYKIDGKERDSWQLRKMVLEDLFFGVDLP